MFRPQSLQSCVDHLGLGALATRGDLTRFVVGATSDSRQVAPGFLFVAIPGSQVDGTDFVPAAIAAGAIAVAAVRPIPLPDGIAFIQVDSPYAAAARIAEWSHDFPARSLKIYGITGTNGKTTCAFLLRDILQHAGQRPGMIGTVHYELGNRTLPADRTTPTAFDFQAMLAEMVGAGLESVVLEISSHALDQRRIGSVPLHGALFTNLSGDHLDYHLTMERYLEAKTLLFTEYLAPGAPAVLNCDDPDGARMAAHLLTRDPPVRLRTYGCTPGANACMRDCRTSLTGTTLSFALPDGDLSLSTPAMGLFNAYNVAGVVALADALGIPWDAIKAATAAFEGAPGRLEPITGTNGLKVFVDYAHTDDALRNVLATLRALNPETLRVVFGCGGERDRSKRARMAKVAAELADVLIITTDNPRREDPARIIDDMRAGLPPDKDATVIADRATAIHQAVADSGGGDALLIAGKGHEKYQEIEGVKHPFSDGDQVRVAMRAAGILPRNIDAGRNPDHDYRVA